ncbi:hypothetical protein [Saccharibacillus kuerlensis]|uniref:Uncharacterized protein n=1 Tax=Saccharibacillus kuerlensis TaxID=459527 RepID=A0ABQ2L5A0_9BACL|nr:hypothetical protein [Saccharibacillus kuerlensis]GGO03978.1 hypothetical protein GCM10010969_28760 [Saccharibacillus kuerlensis]
MRDVRESPSQNSGELRLLKDYRLESWLASGRYPQREIRSNRGTREDYHWTQRVQYAVGHAVNRFYSIQPEFRSQADTAELVDYRWPRKISYFDSEKSYWELKDRVTDHLASFFASNGYEGQRPVMLYEQFETEVTDLGIDLSMVFQAVWQNENLTGLHLQKFVVDYDPEVLDGYRHAARVFCREAFGSDPETIEIYKVLSGERIELDLKGIPYEKSLDYLRLAYGSMETDYKQEPCTYRSCRQEPEGETGFRVC